MCAAHPARRGRSCEAPPRCCQSCSGHTHTQCVQHPKNSCHTVPMADTTPDTPAVTPPCSRHVAWTAHLPLSPSDIPQIDGAAPDPELEDGLRPDPEPDPDPDISYLNGYRRRPYSVNRPWTQYDLDKKTLCASCGTAVHVVRINKIICNCMYVKKGRKCVLKC